MSAINIEVTKNVYDVDLQQEVTNYEVTLEKGYYPLPSNVDLSNYYTKNEVDVLFNQTYDYINGSIVDYNNTIQTQFLDYYTKFDIDSQFLNYYTKTEVDTNLATKLDKPTTDGTYLVKKEGSTISYEAFPGGGVTKTTFTHDILVANWTLVSGKYEAVISNAGILADSFVDVIPSNDNVDIVRNAQIFPSVLVSAGSVKVYSKFLPSGTISVTVNII